MELKDKALASKLFRALKTCLRLPKQCDQCPYFMDMQCKRVIQRDFVELLKSEGLYAEDESIEREDEGRVDP